MPVAEDMQLGMSIGMAMAGKVPITIFPRMDFLMCCMNQLVNHLDKFPDVKVIIRTCVGQTKPMYPGSQHCGDYTDGLCAILRNVEVFCSPSVHSIEPIYRWAYMRRGSTLLIEYGDMYND